MMDFLFLLWLLQMLWWTEAQERTYLITAPKVLRLDATETILVQLFGYQEETIVDVYLTDTLATGKKTFVSQSVKLNGQNNYQALATLRIYPDIGPDITHVYLNAKSHSFSTSEKITLSRDNGFLFIQTDKPLYTPEQKVEVRVYSLNAELGKTNRPVSLTFMDPDGLKVEIIELEDINGVKPLVPPFKIPLKPKFGIWKIEAAYTYNFTTTARTEFEVKEYVLPSISLRIQPETYYVSTTNFEAFKLSIFAKYVSGEPVELADVFLRLGYIHNQDVVMIPLSLKYYKMYDGELEVTLNIKQALSKMTSGPRELRHMDNYFLRVVVLLQESTGGISQDAVLSNVKFVHAPYTLSLIATPPFIKPSLPYTIRVLVKDPLGEPVKGVPVMAQATLTNSFQELEPLKFGGVTQDITQPSQSDGVALFTCSIPSNAERAEFKFQTTDQRYPSDSQASLTLSTEAYKSVNSRYLYIDLRSDSSIFEVDSYANVLIYFYYRDYLQLKTFSYQIISKGKVVKYETVTRGDGNSHNINFQLTADMVPSARLVIYYILTGQGTAELVADSVWFDVKAKCVNSLDMMMTVPSSEAYKPKEKIDLSIRAKSASEKSLVALSAIDMAMYNIRSNDKDPLNKVLRHFEKSDLGCGGGGGRNNIDVFSRAGLTFLTNANVKASQADETCTAVLRPKRNINEQLEENDDVDTTVMRAKHDTPELKSIFEEKAKEYRQYKSCCLAGTESSPTLETCRDRRSRLRVTDKLCKAAFYQCCNYAEQVRSKSETRISVARFDDAYPTLVREERVKVPTPDRAKRDTSELKTTFEVKAEEYRQYKSCCLAGTDSSPTLETCRDRTRRLQVTDKQCKAAFYQCCNYAEQVRSKSKTTITLSRTEIEILQDVKSVQVRSYFPESWLWEEHEIQRSGLLRISKSLPDSLTTWEMKAVGVFSNGICVADPVKVSVSQAIHIDVPLPYSMVRGEQIELKGSVYNRNDASTRFSVTLSTSEGVCVFRGTLLSEDGDVHVNQGYISAKSVTLLRFFIMALEAGNHELRFTLSTKWGEEILIKTLRVVPEGIRKEILTGGRLDPQGIYGQSITRVELKNSLPPKLVPKSTVERLITVNGEVLGELVSIITDPKGLIQLTNLPRGSAEVELMALLPIFYVYDYIEQTEQWDRLGEEASISVLRRKMKEGINSILSFKLKHEHSFSYWKNKEASTWLTALVVKTLAQVNKYFIVDHVMLSNTVRWLITRCQNQDGSFSEKSTYKPLKLMGAGADATEQTVYLTSFVLIGIKNALSVPKSNLKEYEDALERATEYLSSQVTKVKNLYVRAIAAYALARVDLKGRHGISLYEKLKTEAKFKGSPAVVRFWEESGSRLDTLKPNKISSTSVETTIYVLLTTLLRGDTTYAKPVINWLTQDQRYGGGFYSTQEAILTLEALVKYRILLKKAFLQMDVEISYRKKGDIGQVSLTQKKPVGKPMEVLHAEDVILKTGFSSGVSFAKLRTVYYETTESNDDCQFDISIDVHPRVPSSKDPMLISPRIVACAKYKPRQNEVEIEAGHSVMEINLPTGVRPVIEDLKRFTDGLESRVSDFEILPDKLILQIDSIPSEEFYCVGFRIQEQFKTGMNSASTFKVYEYHDPGNQCTKSYFSQTRRLLRLCKDDHCQCMAAECCNFKPNIDPSITAEKIKDAVCKHKMNYVLRLTVTSTEAEGEFLTYNANVESVLQKGNEDIRMNTEVGLVKKATCSSTNLEIGKQYLFMGAEVMQVRVQRSYRYRFPLDSRATVEWWPTDSECRSSSCRQHAEALNDFESEYGLDGCN